MSVRPVRMSRIGNARRLEGEHAAPPTSDTELPMSRRVVLCRASGRPRALGSGIMRSWSVRSAATVKKPGPTVAASSEVPAESRSAATAFAFARRSWGRSRRAKHHPVCLTAVFVTRPSSEVGGEPGGCRRTSKVHEATGELDGEAGGGGRAGGVGRLWVG